MSVAMATAFDKSSKASVLNIIKAQTWPSLRWIWSTCRDQYLTRENLSFTVASRWRYYCSWLLACRCIQVRTLIKYTKFDALLTRNTQVKTTSSFIVEHQNSPCHHRGAVPRELIIFTVMHYQGRKSFPSISEPDLVCIKSNYLKWCSSYKRLGLVVAVVLETVKKINGW